MAFSAETLGAAIAICGVNGGGGGGSVGAYTFKGSVATVNDLPTLGNEVGDIYDVQATGMNYAWTGEAWDALGQLVDVSALEDEIDKKVDKANAVTGVKGSSESHYKTGNVNISKVSIGLSEVDNTSDLNKPISTATQAALDDKQDTLTFDPIPMSGSTNPVTSDGVYRSLVNNLDDILPSILNSANYAQLMKLWFSINGAAPLTDFNDLCEKWYTITRTGWTGGTRFYHATTSMASEGTKVGDNADMVAVPSTNETAGRDDYQDIPLFKCLDCNWILDENGKPHITAIEGVCGNFERYNPNRFVGVIQMCGWHKYVNDTTNDTYTHMYTDVVGADGYLPLPEGIDADNTYRSWVVHAKYASGDDYGCYSGVAPWTYTASHDDAVDAFHNKWGSQYGGKTSADDAFLKLMFFLKYANLSADGVLQGCVNYNYQYAVAEQETGVERVILTASQANNIKVGSAVIVGNPTAFSSGTTLNIDRGQAGMRAKVDRKLVTRKETLQSGNVAVYIDNGGVTFDTTADTITTTGDAPTYISTSPWYAGTCDNVKGVDGSPTNHANGSEPVLLQGIEYANGAYEVISDSKLKYYQDGSGAYHLTVYVCRDASKYAKGSTATNYELVGYEVDCPDTNSWQYISEHGHDDDNREVWFPDVTGCTSSQRTKDAIYILAQSTGWYDWRSVGVLVSGVGDGGLSIVYAYRGLAHRSWAVSARLSSTGTRGWIVA